MFPRIYYLVTLWRRNAAAQAKDAESRGNILFQGSRNIAYRFARIPSYLGYVLSARRPLAVLAEPRSNNA